MSIKLKWIGIWVLGCSFMSCSPQYLLTRKGDKLPMEISRWVDPGETMIREGDKVTVSIWGFEELSVGSSYERFNSGEVTGRYIYVSQDGTIELPLIGKITLSGLTIREANLFITELYKKYLVAPIVNLKVLNLNFTILGEVNSPGNYILQQERHNLLQALGDAGGVTQYADLKKTMVYRKIDDEWQDYHVDLTDFEVLNSSFTRLQVGDIIYIPPNGRKVIEKESSSLTPLISIFSSVAIILSLLLRQ
ncbi:MAG: polysaccharide biosynthesis/export family protein [Bacteroidota bacterium]